MNKLLNISSKIFLILSELSFFFFYIISSDSFIIGVLKLILGSIIIFTTIIDLIKKREYAKKYNIVILCISVLILYTIFRPFLDYSFLVPELSSNNSLLYILELAWYICVKNSFQLIIIYILIFIGNYVNIKTN